MTRPEVTGGCRSLCDEREEGEVASDPGRESVQSRRDGCEDRESFFSASASSLDLVSLSLSS